MAPGGSYHAVVEKYYISHLAFFGGRPFKLVDTAALMFKYMICRQGLV